MKKLKYLVRDMLRLILRPKGYTFLRFVFTHKYIPNFSKPESFSEKIMYRKFKDNPNKFSKLVDKFTVRRFVREKIGEEYLIPLILVSDNLLLNDFKNLPYSFVIKTTHGGGGNNVLVVDDKNKINIQDTVVKFNKELKIKFGSKIDELFYNIEKPRVVIENLISNLDRTPLLDYKFHVFKNNSSVFYLLQINSEYNTENCTKTLYDINGFKSDIQFSGYNYGADKIDLPENMNKMIEIVDILSEGFKYVRVDLFNVDGIIYFGEMTFCPASGWDKLNTKENDFKLGSMWGEYS